jgi:hypothetical protein
MPDLQNTIKNIRADIEKLKTLKPKLLRENNDISEKKVDEIIDYKIRKLNSKLIIKLIESNM